MSTGYKILGVLLLLAACVLGGFYLGKGQKEVQVQEKIVYKEGETKIVYKDRTVIHEKIVKPDGTVIERDITKDISQEVERRSKEIAEQMIKNTKPVLSNYSLGVKYWLPVSMDVLHSDTYKLNNTEIQAGRRLMGEVWGQVGYKLDNSISLGVSVQF